MCWVWLLKKKNFKSYIAVGVSPNECFEYASDFAHEFIYHITIVNRYVRF